MNSAKSVCGSTSIDAHKNLAVRGRERRRHALADLVADRHIEFPPRSIGGILEEGGPCHVDRGEPNYPALSPGRGSGVHPRHQHQRVGAGGVAAVGRSAVEIVEAIPGK